MAGSSDLWLSIIGRRSSRPRRCGSWPCDSAGVRFLPSWRCSASLPQLHTSGTEPLRWGSSKGEVGARARCLEPGCSYAGLGRFNGVDVGLVCTPFLPRWVVAQGLAINAGEVLIFDGTGNPAAGPAMTAAAYQHRSR